MATLYTNGIIITVDHDRRILRNGYILVEGNRIKAVGDTSQPPSDLPRQLKHVNLQRKIVIPGLINSHIHLIQSLMKGLAEDLDLYKWASCAIWPMEVAYEGDDGYVAALLAMAEMLKSGTTCFLEPMLPASARIERVADAVGEVGIRGCLVGKGKDGSPEHWESYEIKR